MLKMFTKTFFLCFFLTLHIEGLMSCRWMDHKFAQYSNSCLTLLDTMGGNFTEDAAAVSFPYNLYKQASNSSSEQLLSFVVQTLEEVTDLLDGNLTSVSWEQKQVEDFINVVTQQEDGLRSCIGNQKKKSKKLHMYFKRLSRHVLERMNHSAESWELIRREIRNHLLRIDLMVSTIKTI